MTNGNSDMPREVYVEIDVNGDVISLTGRGLGKLEKEVFSAGPKHVVITRGEQRGCYKKSVGVGEVNEEKGIATIRFTYKKSN